MQDRAQELGMKHIPSQVEQGVGCRRTSWRQIA